MAEEVNSQHIEGFLFPLTSAGDHEEAEHSPSKQPKMDWQDTLIAILAGHEQQLMEVSRQANMASGPTPSPLLAGSANSFSAHMLLTTKASFTLSEFSPNVTGYSMEERLVDATKMKEGRKRHCNDYKSRRGIQGLRPPILL